MRKIVIILSLLSLVLWAGCAADDEVERSDATSPGTTRNSEISDNGANSGNGASSAEAPDPSGCTIDDDDCREAFRAFHGCEALNGEWRGEFSGGFGRNTIEGDIAVSIVQDGCEVEGTASFTGALCLSSGTIEALIEGDDIEGILSDPQNTVRFFGAGAGLDMAFEFEVLEGLRICRDIVGEAALSRID